MARNAGRIDTLALDGLRGLASVHVVVGHFLHTGCPAIEMSLFYLLSGFTLTLAYGRRKTEESSCTKTSMFYKNRFARTAPSFYIANLVAFIQMYKFQAFFQNKNYQIRWFFTLTITNSWFSFLTWHSEAFDGPSWTISTLTLMYFVFPWIITPLKKLSDASLAHTIVLLYYIQLLPFFFLVFTYPDHIKDNLQ